MSTAGRTILQALAIVAIGGTAAYFHASARPIRLSGEPAAAVPGQPQPADSPIKTITLEEARALFDEGHVAFVDARDSEEYEKGHVPGAFWLPFAQFMSGKQPEAIQFLPADQPIVIYCEGGDCHASHQVAEMLLDFGFKDLRVMTDGWPAWEAGGHPVDKGPPPTGS